MVYYLYTKIIKKHYIDDTYIEYQQIINDWEHECEYYYNDNECNECKNHKSQKQNMIHKWLNEFKQDKLFYEKYIVEHIYDINEHKHPKYNLTVMNKINVATKIKELSFRLLTKTKKKSKSENIDKIFYAMEIFKNIYNNIDYDDEIQILIVNMFE